MNMNIMINMDIILKNGKNGQIKGKELNLDEGRPRRYLGSL